ncbi:hypothetical protein [Haloprofundus halobius]|uniref:hypothetical protein n=1 Tax=Haloprofundus halobius TaxID=2876194 RepID=UPI001CC9F84B|nr:hypothetical protein [Haloprofundus halobius]
MPYGVALTITLFGSVVACVYWATRAVRTNELRAHLLWSWLAAGLAIPPLLTKGYTIHYYYLWGLLAPFSLTVAIGGRHFLEYLEQKTSIEGEEALLSVISALVVASLLYSAVFQIGLLGGSSVPVAGQIEGEGLEAPNTMQASAELRELDANPDEILFVGEWENDFNRDTGRVVVYSDMLIRQRTITESGGPERITDPDAVRDCSDLENDESKIVFHRVNGTITTLDCR